MVELIEGIPRAFISYSWDDEEHRRWVAALGARLRGDGVDLVLDEWHLHPGDQAPAFMEGAIRSADFVLIICTPNYRQKSDGRRGGVGYEGNVITAEMLTSGNDRKFIPVLRRGEWSEVAASWLMGKIYVDLRGNPYSEESYLVLLNSIFRRLPKPPPIGAPKPDISDPQASMVRIERERLYGDLLNAAVRVSEETIKKRHLIKSGDAAAKKLLTSEVEPELKRQAARCLDLVNRALLVGSEAIQEAVKNVARHVLIWQIAALHPDGDNIHEQQFREFNTESIPRLRDAVREELARL
jgi:hypothetical protein